MPARTSLPPHPDPSSPSRRGAPLLLSNLLDAAGRQGSDLATDVLAVAVLGATAAQMGLLNAVGTLAFLVLGIPIGVMVDRSPTLRLLVGSGMVRAGLLSTLMVAWAVDALTMVHLYAVAALAGVTTVVTETAQTAIVPRITGTSGVSGLVSRMQSAESAVGLIVPALAGAAVALTGAGPILAVTATLTAVAALVVLRVRLGRSPEPTATADPAAPTAGRALGRLFHEARRGWSTLRGNRALWRLTLGAMIINLGLAVHSAVEVVLVLRTLDLGSTTLGLVVSAGALGALLGSLIAVPLSKPLGVPTVLRTSILLLAPVAGLTLAAVMDPDRAVGWLLAGSFLWGMVMVTYNVINAGLVAELTPPQLMGRVAATRRTLTMGVVPLGSLAGGLTADHAGVPVAVTAWIILTAIGAVVAATAPTTQATSAGQ
ncbi:MAG: MFS transporter [Citricoccus sp.]